MKNLDNIVSELLSCDRLDVYFIMSVFERMALTWKLKKFALVQGRQC